VSIKDRDIRAALEERGWVMWRSKNEQIWMKGPDMVRVRHSLKSKWIAQAIIKELIQVEQSKIEG
jgi:predicted XRE-type DNA-binding protein